MKATIVCGAWLGSLFLSGSSNAPVLQFPERLTTAIVIDGKFSEKEWEGADETALAPEIKLLTLQTKDDVWLAIRLKPQSLSYVDLFLVAADEKIINLHASMQVGERVLPSKGWTDEVPKTHWGRQDRWQANFVKQVPGKEDSAPLGEILVPYEGFEFRLSKKRFTGQHWRMRIEVRDFEGKKPDVVFPPESDRFQPTGWATVSLDLADKSP